MDNEYKPCERLPIELEWTYEISMGMKTIEDKLMIISIWTFIEWNEIDMSKYLIWAFLEARLKLRMIFMNWHRLEGDIPDVTECHTNN